MLRQRSLPNYFASKAQKICCVIIFLSACNKKTQRANATDITYDRNDPPLRLVEDGMSTGLTNTHTARGFFDLYHVFARKNAFSVLHYVMVALH